MADDRQVVFNNSDMEDVSPTPHLNLPDIKELRCMRPKDGAPYLVFYCTSNDEYLYGCPNCGSVDIVKNGFADRQRVVHDINIGILRVDLLISVPRYKCNDCDSSFRYRFDSIRDGLNRTERLTEQICRDAFVRPFTEVAAAFGYTEGTIRKIFDAYADELELKRGPIFAPKVLGIDEKHIVNAMRGIFVDAENGRLLEMTEDNKKGSIISTIESMIGYDENIKIVTMDMSNGYRSHVQMCLPKAKIVVDKFHVYQILYQRISKAKTAIMAEIGRQIADEQDPAKAKHLSDMRLLITHNAYLFKFGKKKLLEKTYRIPRMADICSTFPELNHLRLIKEGFEKIYEESTSRNEAEDLYFEWSKLIPPCNATGRCDWEKEYGLPAELYKELQSFYDTTQNWHNEIFNYFDTDCSFTNAVAEGTNSMIQRINSQGNGYGFKRLRAKALYWQEIAGRATYQINTKEVPIYGSPVSVSDMGTSNIKAFKTFGTFNRLTQITDKKYVSEVLQDPISKRKDLSVLDYVDSESEYYDFDE